ncbi:MAG TPA: class I SAM-dependent methyltransferase [Gammaproteobacteria bacterium]|nr:class I SAM-dependent methyltransferase [Gammaproteobacteria bacterium]HIL98309.1 class I SAM-dependent methyltransferase [Pseudomonadales bacterium]
MMAANQRDRQRVPGDWDVYWTGTHENAAHQEGGPQEEVLERFWLTFFAENSADNCSRERQRLLDMACGNGAVTGFASRGIADFHSFCLDTSVNALLELGKRYPETICITADALHTPFLSNSFDLVVSQFGIEYAGIDTFDEAARLLAPGGSFGAVIHLHEGAIYRECSDNLNAINAIMQSRLLKLARNTFSAGFALNAGTGSVKAFKTAERKLKPAVRALESMLQEMGSNVAAGLAQQLHEDIAYMYKRMGAFDKREVISWLDGMVKELRAYRGRMTSMMSSAVDKDAMKAIKQNLETKGLVQQRCETLGMGPEQQPAAWVIVCKKH